MASSVDGGAQKLKALCSIVLAEKPSCIQFCPASPDLLVVGLYTLDDGGTQKRTGRLQLFQLKDDKVTELYSLRREYAVLNLEFSPFLRKRFVTAMSGGRIGLHDLEGDQTRGTAYIEGHGIIRAFPPSTIVLALSWHKCCKYILGLTLSTGDVAIIQFDQKFMEGRVIHKIPHPHTNEAWSLAWTPSPYSVDEYPNQGLYSGGDDSRLRGIVFALKPSHNISAATQIAIIGGKAGLPGHNAGVTAILPLPLGFQAGEDIILTGSYDDHIRVYTLRDHRPNQPNHRPKVLAELNLGDGVWRLNFLRDYSVSPSPPTAVAAADKDQTANDKKNDDLLSTTATTCLTALPPVQTHTFRVLASCMRAGAQILQIQGTKGGKWSITRLATFTDHESMCYASAVQPVPEEESLAARLDDRSIVCVSTSFYDRLLCVWRFREEGGT